MLRYLEKTSDQAAEELKTTAHSNLSACYLKEANFDKTIEHCQKVLDKQPKNVKSLFRLGQAYLGDKNFDKAKETLLQAQELDPEDKGIQNELKKVKAKEEEIQKSEKNLYSKMFGK
jgi:FK506-binding protein 8